MAMNPLAYYEMAAGVGQNYLAGQQRGQENALLMHQLSRDAATQNALAQYFATAPEGRAAAINELAAIDPAAAANAMAIDQGQRQIRQEEERARALREYTEAEYVLRSETPSLALRLLDEDGTFLRQLEEHGLIDSADGISDDEARLIAQWARDTTAPIAGITPAEPDSFARKLATVEGKIQRALTDEEVLKLAGGGTTINIGDKLNEPIPITSIGNVRTPDGKPVPIGTTFQQAREMGAEVFTSDDQKREQQADAALGVLGELEELALGPSGAFTNIEPGFINRAGAAIMHGLELLTQNKPEASRYEDLSRSTLAPFIKMLGESGALAEGDVTRALGLLPRSFPLPDTKEVAQEKLRALREIVTRGVRNFNSTTPAPGSAPAALPPLPPGFTLDE